MRLPSLAPLGHFLAASKAKIAPKIKDLKERAGRVRFENVWYCVCTCVLCKFEFFFLLKLSAVCIFGSF